MIKKKEVKNSDVTKLDDGQLKALLDEAITYKCPKDREGKSNLFKELLQEVEADENNTGDFPRALKQTDGAGTSRHSSSNRRRKRDGNVSERQSRGGSLQNLVHALNTEFESGHCGNNRKRNKRYGSKESSVNVSARQLEGGSLPSDVNVGETRISSENRMSGIEFFSGSSHTSSKSSRPEGARHSSFPKICLQPRSKDIGHYSATCEYSTYPTPIYSSPEILDEGSDHSFSTSDYAALSPNNADGTSDDEYQQTESYPKDSENKFGESYTYKVNNFQDLDVIKYGDEADNAVAVQPCTSTSCDPMLQVNYTSHASLEVGNGIVSTDEECEIENHIVLQSLEMNPAAYDQNVDHATLQLPSSYSAVKCIMGGTSDSADTEQSSKSWEIRASVVYCASAELYRNVNEEDSDNNTMMQKNVFPTHMSVLSIPPNRSWLSSQEAVGKLTFNGNKDVIADVKVNKPLDENGNALNQNYCLEPVTATERKNKPRRRKASNDSNVILSQHIEGYRGDKDIKDLIKFIESDSDSKGKHKTGTHNTNSSFGIGSKQNRSAAKKDESACTGRNKREALTDLEKGGKCRSHGNRHGTKDNKHSGRRPQLKKSNSLEELSKTNLEDLGLSATDECVKDFPSIERLQSIQETFLDSNVVLESARVSGRRSWGSDGQCTYSYISSQENDTNKAQTLEDKIDSTLEEFNSSNSSWPESLPILHSPTTEELDFHIVTKKQRRKKRRSISRGRGVFYPSDPKRVSTNMQQGSVVPNKQQSNKDYSVQLKKPITRNEAVFSPHNHSTNHILIYPYHHLPNSPEHRRNSTSSMPPSDKSDKSDCSDLDSVQSLPVSSTIPDVTLDHVSTSGYTPQASYADITRMATTHVNNGNTVKVMEINSSKTQNAIVNNLSFISNERVNPITSYKMMKIVNTVPVSKLYSASNSVFPKITKVSQYKSKTTVSDENKKDATTSTTLDDKSPICEDIRLCSNICMIPRNVPDGLRDSFPSLPEKSSTGKCKSKYFSYKTDTITSLKSGTVSSSKVDTVSLPDSEVVSSETDAISSAKSDIVSSSDIDTLTPSKTNDVSIDAPSEESDDKMCEVTSNSENVGHKDGASNKYMFSASNVCSDYDNVNKQWDADKSVPEDKSVSEKDNKIKTLPKSKTLSVKKSRPPVILLDEQKWHNSDCDRFPLPYEVTFGFEVNEQLLSGKNDSSNLQGALCDNRDAAVAETVPQFSSSAKAVLNDPNTHPVIMQQPQVSHNEHQNIVNFVKTAWEEICRNADTPGSNIRYYTKK